MDRLCLCLVFAMPLCASVICALWSPAGKRLASWLLVVVSVSLSLSHCCPGSDVVLDCIDSRSLHPTLLCFFVYVLTFCDVCLL